MNLLRGLGRAMLAGFYIVNGAKAVRSPDDLVPAAEPLAQKFVPFAQQSLPEGVSAYLPEETRSLVRVNGVVSVLGGLGMGLGVAPRGGAYLAAASMAPHLAASWPKGADDRDAARSIFLRNLALTGAALVVSQDTRGYPSLVWQAKDARARTIAAAKRRKEIMTKDAQRLSGQAKREARRAAKRVRSTLK